MSVYKISNQYIIVFKRYHKETICVMDGVTISFFPHPNFPGEETDQLVSSPGEEMDQFVSSPPSQFLPPLRFFQQQAHLIIYVSNMVVNQIK